MVSQRALSDAAFSPSFRTGGYSYVLNALAGQHKAIKTVAGKSGHMLHILIINVPPLEQNKFT